MSSTDAVALNGTTICQRKTVTNGEECAITCCRLLSWQLSGCTEDDYVIFDVLAQIRKGIAPNTRAIWDTEESEEK